MNDPDDMSTVELLERAVQVNNSRRIDESPAFWIGKALDRLREDGP